jgi:hypothetical protein
VDSHLKYLLPRHSHPLILLISLRAGPHGRYRAPPVFHLVLVLARSLQKLNRSCRLSSKISSTGTLSSTCSSYLLACRASWSLPSSSSISSRACSSMLSPKIEPLWQALIQNIFHRALSSTRSSYLLVCRASWSLPSSSSILRVLVLLLRCSSSSSWLCSFSSLSPFTLSSHCMQGLSRRSMEYATGRPVPHHRVERDATPTGCCSKPPASPQTLHHIWPGMRDLLVDS